MQIVALLWGILSAVGMLVAFLPCLGSLNWLNIPFSVLGLILSVIVLVTTKEGSKTGSIIGTILCGLAVLLGLGRLILGGGIL